MKENFSKSHFLHRIPQVSPKINDRTRPKNIPQDKERLYDEVLKMKTLNHALQEENYKLKTRVSFLEKDAIRYEKMIHEASVELDLPPKTSESHLILSLKNQVKELKNSLFTRDEELLEIKRKIKYTKAQELEVTPTFGDKFLKSYRNNLKCFQMKQQD